LFGFPAAGIMGKTGVATRPARSTGCVVIGPAIIVFFAMPDHSIWRRQEARQLIAAIQLFLTNDRGDGPNSHRRRTRTAPER